MLGATRCIGAGAGKVLLTRARLLQTACAALTPQKRYASFSRPMVASVPQRFRHANGLQGSKEFGVEGGGEKLAQNVQLHQLAESEEGTRLQAVAAIANGTIVRVCVLEICA